MPKILIAYYSKTGNTERVAKDIATGLGADVEKIIDKKNRKGILGWIFAGRDGMQMRLTEIEDLKKNPTDYGLVILGTPVWGWNATPAIRTYIEKTKANLKNIAIFMTSGGTQPEKIVKFLEDMAGKKSVASIGFVPEELKDEKLYKEKLSGFINQIKNILR